MIGNIVAGLTFSSPALNYKDTVLLDNPIGFWLLDETSGSTMGDYSTNVINGTYYNTPTLNQAGTGGSIDKSVFFDGASSENAYTATVSTFNFAPSSNWSMEIWFKDNNTINTTIETCFCVRGDTGLATDVLGLFYLNNGVAGRTQVSTTNAAGSGSIILTYDRTPDTNWHQLVATSVSGGDLKLYIDAVERGSSSASRYASTINKKAVVASNWSSPTAIQFTTANLAAVSIYNTTLSAARITAHYNAGI